MSRLTGLTTCGRYKFSTAARVGSGIEADVYAGRHTSATGNSLALKIYKRSRPGAEPADVILQAIPPHPAILKLLDITRASNRPAFVFPLLTCDLHSYCFDGEDASPMPEAATAHLLSQLLDSLQHLHVHNFSHNDVKPQNVLVAAEGPDRMLTIVLG